MFDPRNLTGKQIAILLAFGVLVIILAAFAPLIARWFLPILGITWTVLVFMTVARLARLGRPTIVLRLMAAVIGAASLLRLLYLVQHAA